MLCINSMYFNAQRRNDLKMICKLKTLHCDLTPLHTLFQILENYPSSFRDIAIRWNIQLLKD